MKLFGKQDSSPDGAEMGFFDHIDALRGHLFRSSLAVVFVTIILLIKSKWVFDELI